MLYILIQLLNVFVFNILHTHTFYTATSNPYIYIPPAPYEPTVGVKPTSLE